MDEDEFIVNSEKPTKLNANKFAAVVCVWWKEDRVFVDVYVCVCVFSCCRDAVMT